MRRLAIVFALLGIGVGTSWGQPSNYAWDRFGMGGLTMTNDAPVSGIISNITQANQVSSYYLVEWDSYTNKWSNTSTPFNQEFTLFWGGGSYNGPNGNLSTSTTVNRYYTLQIDGLGYSDRQAVLMETDNAPIGISMVSQNPSTVYPGQDVTVTVTLGGNKSSQEKVFVRYTSDNFATSDVAEVSFTTATSPSGSATIPASSNTAGANVIYYVYSTTVAATSSSNHDLITLNLENNGGSNYSYTVESSWITASGATTWNTPASWDAGEVPPAGQPVTIEDNITLNTDVAVASLEITTGNTLTSESGQARTLTINSGGAFTNNGTFTANVGTVVFNGNNTISGTVSFNDVNISGGVNFGGSSTVTGTLTINAGGFVNTNPPTYATNSTLNYNGLTNYGAGDSWTQNATSGQGVPFNVTLTGNTSLNFGANTDYRQCNGNFTIEDGSTLTLSTATGGDLRIGGSGNWINNNAVVGNGFVSNNRAIRFVGTTNQNMSNSSGTTTVGYLLVEKPNGNLILDNNIVLNGTGTAPAPVLQLLNAGSLNLNAFSITIAGDQARSIEVDGSRSIIGTGELIFEDGSGDATVTSTSSGTLNIGASVVVTINKGVDFGNHTTIEGKLILENGSFCQGSSPTYGNAATLEYRTGPYTTSNEWVAGTAVGVGVPYNVIVNMDAGTDRLSIAGSNAERTVPGDLTVTQGGVSVANNNTLSVGGNIANNGTVEVASASSLVQTAAADGNTGSGTYNVTRNTGTLVDDTRYQLWSSPVASANMGTVFTGANTSDFYAFDVSTQNWASHSGTMTPGKGYMSTGTINISGTDEDRIFSGNVNNGDVTYTFASSISSTQYAAVGNPYPSAIDIATFIGDQTNISNTIYFWDHATGTNTDYATFTSGSGGTAGSGGVTPDAYVQVAQGFIVEATVGSASSVVFENDQRVSGNNTQFFKGRTETRERMWLNALSNAGNNQILVAFVPEATDGFDALYDGKKLKGNPNFAFYSVLEDEDYAIQGLNSLLPEETKVIPLGIDLSSPGEVRFELDSLDNWPTAYSAYLIDKEANAEHDLLTGGAYVVQLADSGSIRDRFELVVNRAPEAPSSVEELNGDRVRLWMSNQELFVQFAEDRGGVAQVDVFDLAGRAVHTSNQDQNRYALTGLDHGTYVVRVTFGNASVKTQTLVNMP